MLGAIEGGGTKFVLAIGTGPTDIAARHTIPTGSPAETLEAAAQWFERQGRIDALGIGCFGPLRLDQNAPGWGSIANTPKPGWADCEIVSFFRERLQIPIGFDTDVNGAALAEAAHGAGKGISSLAYITVGTGIGGGLVIDGRPVHGVAHPEMGHIFVRRLAGDRQFSGICPHHGDCLEGLASGPAIIARWGSPLSELPEDHEAHGIIASYLAQLCYTLFSISAVERVVLGGGVMKTPGLLDRIPPLVRDLNARYLPGGAQHVISGPGLGEDSGIVGALMLAQNALAFPLG